LYSIIINCQKSLYFFKRLAKLAKPRRNSAGYFEAGVLGKISYATFWRTFVLLLQYQKQMIRNYLTSGIIMAYLCSNKIDFKNYKFYVGRETESAQDDA
jgi:hypothetical protein